jgi:hypothetical protein
MDAALDLTVADLVVMTVGASWANDAKALLSWAVPCANGGHQVRRRSFFGTAPAELEP